MEIECRDLEQVEIKLEILVDSYGCVPNEHLELFNLIFMVILLV